MHHQVQQPRNVGLKALRFAAADGSAVDCPSVVKATLIAEITPETAGLGVRSYRPRIRCFQAEPRGFRRNGGGEKGKKKSGSAGRGPADPPACVAMSRFGSHPGCWGAKIAGCFTEPHHRGSAVWLANRWGAAKTQMRRHQGRLHTRVTQNRQLLGVLFFWPQPCSLWVLPPSAARARHSEGWG